jgi:hypothetical protein
LSLGILSSHLKVVVPANSLKCHKQKKGNAVEQVSCFSSPFTKGGFDSLQSHPNPLLAKEGTMREDLSGAQDSPLF